MTIFSRLRKRQDDGQFIQVAVVGAGLMGRGMVRQIDLTPGMRTALIVNRTIDHAIDAHIKCGHQPETIVVSHDVDELRQAIQSLRPAVTPAIDVVGHLPEIDVVIEVTGAVEYGAQVALQAINSGKHIVMMNAETDATVGCALKHRADRAGVVYTNADGDQPGVLKRLVEFVSGTGFELVAAVNCKGFMDIHATPDTIRPWAEKQNTSLPMTTAFTDGTKMNIENAVLCNSTGLVPDTRGMHGVQTDLEHALNDCLAAVSRRGVVEYTLGGDFGGGVFVIGFGDDPFMDQPYMQYLKMGPGPHYLFFRPYHLCHLETPTSVAEAVLDGEPTIAPLARPVTDVIAIAKQDLSPGDVLDGIGGYTCYGEIDTAERARGYLPIGMAEGARLTRAVSRAEPIPTNAVELNPSLSTLVDLRCEQESLIESTALS